MKTKIKIDGDFVKDSIEEINKKIESILGLIDRNPENHSVEGSDVQNERSSQDEVVVQELKHNIQNLTNENEELKSKLENLVDSKVSQEKDEEIESLKKKIEDRQVQEETAHRALQEKDEEIENLKKKNVEDRQVQEEAAHRAQQEKDEEIESLKKKNLEERQAQEEAAHRVQQEKDEEIKNLEDKNNELSKEIAVFASNDRIEDVIWPAFMAAESTADYKERLKSELHADEPSPLAVRLVADLFSYNANHKMKSEKKKPLFSSVHRLGESLFAWLSESDPDPDQVSETGQKWADLINEESDNVFKIEVPMIESEFNHKTMVNYGSGSSSADVVRVHSWCVKDSEGRTQHPAEVTLT